MRDGTQLIQSVREQKALAHRNRSVKNWGLLVSFLVGGLGWGIWHFISPAPSQLLKIRFPICIAISCVGYYIWLAQYGKALIPREAACPQCGQCWEIKEGRGVPPSEVMTNWDKCPGCGILMTELLLKRKLESTDQSIGKEKPNPSLHRTASGGR